MFVTGEGFSPHGKIRGEDRDPSSGPDFVRTTFSHKGRREEDTFYFFHNLTSGPSAPNTGSVCGSLTCGIVLSAF